MTIKIVAGDGTGDYNCDGSGDQTTINQALAWAAANPGNDIHLKGPFTYDFTDQILIGSSTVFSGDSTAKLRLNNSCLWSAGIPVIGQRGSDGSYSPGTITHDVEITGFEIDGNETNLYHSGTDRIHGHDYYRIIYFQGQSTNPAYNLSVHGMNIHDSMGDGVRFGYCKTIKTYSNTLSNLEHCAVFVVDCDGSEVYSNTIKTITTSGIRHDNSRNVKIHDNNISDFTGTTHAPTGGAHGIQFGNQPSGHTNLTQNLEIYNNTISVGGCGFQIEDYLKTAGTTAQTAHIYNNHLTGCGWRNWTEYFAGITIYSWGNGLNIEYNTIDGSYRAGILAYGAITSGVTASVKNNNIINSVKAGSGGGYGIWNKVSSSLTIQAENNYCHNNISGNYSGVTPVSEATSSISGSLPTSST
ncbi:MAG TPA: hypothetical protein VHP38_08040, partial [Ruminiclostridium sp.]|nr:hypothetical protein [Ruminiclostridium sp.]